PVLARDRPDAGRRAVLRPRPAVPLGRVLRRRAPAPARGADEEGDRGLGRPARAGRHPDPARDAILARRGLPPGLLEEGSDPLPHVPPGLRPRPAAGAALGRARLEAARSLARARPRAGSGVRARRALRGAASPRAP